MNYLKTGSPFKAGDDKEETLSLALFLDLLHLIATIPLRQGFAGHWGSIWLPVLRSSKSKASKNKEFS